MFLLLGFPLLVWDSLPSAPFTQAAHVVRHGTSNEKWKAATFLASETSYTPRG